MVRLLRFAILVVMFFITVSLIIAVAMPETGAAEKVVLGVAVVGLLFAALPVQRIGSGRARRRTQTSASGRCVRADGASGAR